jgi:hypothetical protein
MTGLPLHPSLCFFLALARMWWIDGLVHPSCWVASIGCIICSVILSYCCHREVEIISAIVTSIMGLVVWDTACHQEQMPLMLIRVWYYP